MNEYDIDKEYKIPKDYISCPSCGQKYGHHKTKVCINCEECSKCCMCKDKKLINAKGFIREYCL